MGKADDLRRRVQRQRDRRMEQRVCGNCSKAADLMLPWGGQRIAICEVCFAKLSGFTNMPAYCSYFVLNPVDIRNRSKETLTEDPGMKSNEKRGWWSKLVGG